MNESQIFQCEFEIRFLKSRGGAFQDLFADLMERAYPTDFQRIRAHGNTGDLKCDGYLNSQKAVFQVYGPDEIRSLSRLLRKVKADYRGARHHWAERMDRWVFVHNSQAGLPAQAVQLLDDLKKEPGSPLVEAWGYQELFTVLRRIASDKLRTLFQWPSAVSQVGLPENLPDQAEIRRYLAWAGTHVQDPLQPRHLAVLQCLALPSRLITTHDAHEGRMAEERGVGLHVIRQGTLLGTPCHRTKIGRPPRRAIDLTFALRRYRRVLVLGESGSGKSTMLRRFVKALAARKSARGFVGGSGRTPILVELWRFSRERPLMNLITISVNRSGARVTQEQLQAALGRGYVVLFLDGLDEVSIDQRRECLAQILELVERAPRTWIVITSRPFPEPPDHFFQLELAPLSDEDIAAALCAYFGSGRAFRQRFPPHCLPAHYVQSALKPQVRQLCRRPLTLAFVLHLLANDGGLPENLYGIYNRILTWHLDWERSQGRLTCVSAAVAGLEEVAYHLRSRDIVGMATTDWLLVAGRAIDAILPAVTTRNESAEQILELFLSSGLLTNSGGEIIFSHRSLLDFLAAKRLANFSAHIHLDPVSLSPGVGVFLCGTMNHVAALLEEYFRRSDNMESLRPLLQEAMESGSEMGRFEGVLDMMEFCEEGLYVHLDYSPPGFDEEDFTHMVRFLVTTCVAFKPAMLSSLKSAADAVVKCTQWSRSRYWFELIIAGLDEHGWPGAVLHRRLCEVGLFERMAGFCNDGPDSEDDLSIAAAERFDQLTDYLHAVYEDDFDSAARHLVQLEKHVRD